MNRYVLGVIVLVVILAVGYGAWWYYNRRPDEDKFDKEMGKYVDQFVDVTNLKERLVRESESLMNRMAWLKLSLENLITENGYKLPKEEQGVLKAYVASIGSFKDLLLSDQTDYTRLELLVSNLNVPKPDKNLAGTLRATNEKALDEYQKEASAMKTKLSSLKSYLGTLNTFLKNHKYSTKNHWGGDKKPEEAFKDTMQWSVEYVGRVDRMSQLLAEMKKQAEKVNSALGKDGFRGSPLRYRAAVPFSTGLGAAPAFSI